MEVFPAKGNLQTDPLLKPTVLPLSQTDPSGCESRTDKMHSKYRSKWLDEMGEKQTRHLLGGLGAGDVLFEAGFLISGYDEHVNGHTLN